MDEVTLDPAVESHIDAFEQALTTNPASRFEEFLPRRNDPRFTNIAVELVRVDLEMSWAAGRGRSLTDYEDLLPELRTDREARAKVAYEEFRQRKFHGEQVTLEDFAAKYDLAATDWSTVIAQADETQTSPHDFAAHDSELPSVGEPWREFDIIEELGRGALSRVYLARQRSLSGRLIVLKFAPKHLFEAEKLAKLQHQHIVPVFSVYEDRHFHVFCMPYAGRRTLAAWMAEERRQDGRPFSEQQTLDLAIKLAEALAHAHSKGIVHNDIKPANILISEDGQPMLLDFNLAADRCSTARMSNVGGTLPYMSPESLVDFTTGHAASDVRSDLYSLGVVLFEMLAARSPFSDTADVPNAVEERRHLPKLLTAEATPGMAAIIDKCLCFDASDRYQSAEQLVTDLRRHQGHQLLRFAPNTSLRENAVKCCRRHPRLTSLSTLTVTASVLLAIMASAWLAREHHVDRLEAESQKMEFLRAYEALAPRLSAIGLDIVDAKATTADAERLLQEYARDTEWKNTPRLQLLEPPSRRELETAIAKLSFLTANAHLWMSRPTNAPSEHRDAAEKWHAISRSATRQVGKSHLYQKARLLAILGDASATEIRQQADAAAPVDANDLQLVGIQARFEGDWELAIQSLEMACEQSPRDFSKWFDLASSYAAAGAWRKAEGVLTACLALRPESMLATYCRGLARHELSEEMDAVADYSRFLSSAPNHPYCLLNRAIAFKSAGDFRAALQDLDAAIGAGFGGPRALIIRSRVRRALGDRMGSSKDRREAIAAMPQDELDWISRGVARMAGSPHQALDDFQNALTLNPSSHAARRNMAHVLAERLQRTDEAIQVLDSVIDDFPKDSAAIAGRGVLLARMGRYDLALEDAQRTIELNGDPRTVLQAACVYALAAKKRKDLAKVAIDLLGIAFQAAPELVELAKVDLDLINVQASPAFAKLCETAEQMANLPTAESVMQTAVGATQ